MVLAQLGWTTTCPGSKLPCGDDYITIPTRVDHLRRGYLGSGSHKDSGYIESHAWLHRPRQLRGELHFDNRILLEDVDDAHVPTHGRDLQRGLPLITSYHIRPHHTIIISNHTAG